MTYHCVPNFGAQLQTVSTVGFLKRSGHEPYVLHWYPQDLEDMYSTRVPESQAKIQMEFAETNLPLTAICRTEDDLVRVVDGLNLDGIVCGSDALFKFVPKRCRSYFLIKKWKRRKINVLSVEDLVENPFFGGFASRLQKKIPVVAYAVSSQNCPYRKMKRTEKKILGANLLNFSHISVRDEWTAGMVKFLLGGHENVEIAPDPVFAFNRNNYLPLPDKSELLACYGIPENYVLLSFNTRFATEEYVKDLASELERGGFCPVALSMPERLQSFDVAKCVDLPLNPLDWYALIAYSKGYVGERMHPIVVALHNSVPFFAFDEYGFVENRCWGIWTRFDVNSSKTYHILEKAGLLSNWVNYRNVDTLPTAEQVVCGIKNFDKAKCSAFAESCLEKYMQEMEKCLARI